jgi:S1-C subfamily serine protease
VALAKPGEPQNLTVWRKGDESTLTVSLGQAPKT